MAKPMGIALHSFISGTPRAPWVPMEAPSSPSPHLPLHVGVSGRPHPGAGWLETGFQVAAHPGARWPETPNSRGFWPSRTRKPRFSGGELVEAKCIVLYFLRLCYIFLRVLHAFSYRPRSLTKCILQNSQNIGFHILPYVFMFLIFFNSPFCFHIVTCFPQVVQAFLAKSMEILREISISAGFYVIFTKIFVS